jgi:hypothetical protein
VIVSKKIRPSQFEDIDKQPAIKEVKMKKIIKMISALALVSASGYAAASIIVAETTPVTLAVSSTAPKTFDINLTDDVGYTGNALLDATLHLVFSDPLGGNERVSIFFGTNPVAAYTTTGQVAASADIALDAAALADLMADGHLIVKFTAGLQGGNDQIDNYQVDSVSLNAHQVPEPASLGLMGITLAGLAAIRRRKQK